MDMKKSLIVVSISSLLMTGFADLAMAKQTDEEDSVYRWGRWAVLAPAAGVEEVMAYAPQGTNDLGRCESGENCPQPTLSGEPVEPVEPPEEPVVKGPCEAGLPCGFARVDRASDSESGSNDYVASFTLDMDEEGGTVAFDVGSGTLLDPETTEDINSDTEGARYDPALVTTLNRRAPTVLRGLITRDEDGVKQVVHGLWGYVDNSGEFVWGVAAKTNELERIASDLGTATVARYQGFTMNGGTAALRVNFDTATWAGNFSGDHVNFSVEAGGKVSGSSFFTNKNTVFSDNIARAKVEGGFVNHGQNAIGGYQVVDRNGVKDADVFNARLLPRVEPTLQ